MKMRLSLLLALVLSLLLLPAAARADDVDAALQQMLGASMVTCKVSGEWAVCDVRAERVTELQLFRFTKGSWRRLGAGQGRLDAPMALALGVPEPVARTFGLGIVPREVRKGLESKGRGQGAGADSYVIVSRATEYLGRTFNAARPGTTIIWAWSNRSWTKLFEYAPADNADAVFRAHGVSPYMQQRLLTTPSSPLDRVPLFK